MKVNACLYNIDGSLEGCITDSVIESFLFEFEEMSKFPNKNDKIIAVLLFLQENLWKSKENYTADFLNALKLVIKKTDQLPIEFIQTVSRSYHNLVQYCCGFQVYDEVLEYVTNILRSAGLEYRGKDFQGLSKQEHVFDYKGITIGVKLHDKNDLYKIWTNTPVFKATIYAEDKKYLIEEYSLDIGIKAIKACIEDFKLSKEEQNEQDDYEEIIQELLNAAKLLIEGQFLDE